MRKFDAPFSRATIVANPAAGSASDADLSALAERLRAAVGDVGVVHTRGPGEAVGLVAEGVAEGVDLVVAVGGDGTVREAAEGLARGGGRWPGGGGANGARPALFVVPAGSGNSVYRALWGDERPWRDALDAVLSGGDGVRVRALDLIRIDEADRGALLGVNVGLVARIAERLEQVKAEGPRPKDDDELQQRYWSVIAEVLQRREALPVRVTVDGDVVHDGPAMLVTVGGVQRFGGGAFALLPQSELDDGVLDVCAIGGLTEEGLQEMSALVPAGQHVGKPGVAYAKGRRIEIERTDGETLVIEHDGDPRPAGTTLTLDVVSGAAPALAGPEAPSG